jgi:hypothetical protein
MFNNVFTFVGEQIKITQERNGKSIYKLLQKICKILKRETV